MWSASIKIDLKSTAVYLLIIVLGVVSYFINVGKGETLQNIIHNFTIPTLFLFIGLSIEDIPKWVNYLSLLIGIAFLVYFSLYYFIGFHNHHWGN
ncbi:hypothetical protein BAU15_02385 [Enterococcus sp. JM4C]|uniref:hypothetical protein n=1 Tax=Candidatus Enterococcus huntleyi TaxID=1857217 RepID=UPI001379CEBF|nr:hypothetical protein [Enterococcus sp. JM4C]KAF1299511.1 hypothetical protein BAU15_02385 [Enterococcus sp. JM4C]